MRFATRTSMSSESAWRRKGMELGAREDMPTSEFSKHLKQSLSFSQQSLSHFENT